MALTTNTRKIISAMLIVFLTGQPALASEQQYRIPYKFSTVGAAPGEGDGVVDAGDNPTPPILTFSPKSLKFDVTGGVRDAQISMLTNAGRAPAAITNIASTPEFSVSHDCPSVLPVGVPCAVAVTPTTSGKPGVQYPMAVMAPGMATPSVLQLSTFERTVIGPAPLLRTTPGLVNLGVNLKPGERASGTTTLTNVGNADATLGGITSGGDFTVTHNCPAVLPAGEHCSISASFSSLVPGSHGHDLQLTSGSSEADTTLALFAYVQRDPSKWPVLTFDKASLSFGVLEPGTSTTQTAYLTNEGTAPAVLEPFLLSSPFTVSSDCPSVLGIEATCAVSITYTASTNGNALLRANAQEGNSEQIFLEGKVRRDDQASKTAFTQDSISFGEVPIGQSPTLAATFTNAGSSAATVKSITFAKGSSVFSQSNNCGSLISAGASCTISVTFKPLTSEQSNAWLQVTFSDDSFISLPVSGAGSAAELTVGPTSVRLGTVMLPGASQLQTVGLGNRGNIPLTGLTVSNTDNRLAIGYGECPTTLQPNQGCTLTLQYAPSVDGIINSSFQINSSNGGSATVNVTGLAVAVTASPSSIAFPTTYVKKAAADQSITLSNNGETALSSITVSIVDGLRQFSQSNNCGSTLQAGMSCTITVRYVPDSVQPNMLELQRGAIAVASGGNAIAYVNLQGTATNPQLTWSPANPSLEETVVTQVSPVTNVTLSNSSKERATLTGISISQGDTEFSQSNNCGRELDADATCTVSVQLRPTEVGKRFGVLSVTSSFGLYNIPLEGTGLAQLEISPSSVAFPSTDYGGSSTPVSVTLKNRTNQAVSFTGMSVSQGASDFSQSNNCGSQLASGEGCAVNVQFTPSATGQRDGMWTLVSSLGTYNVPLSGISEPKLTLSSTAIAFPSTNVGEISNPLSVVVRNLTDRPAVVQGMSITQGASDYGQSNNCGTELAQGASCTVSIQFAPTLVGKRVGTFAIDSNFGFNYAGLTGTGTQPEADVDEVPISDSPSDNFKHYNITFLDTEVGNSSAVRNIKFSNKGTGRLTVEGISMPNGLEDFDTTNNCGATLAPGQFCTISVIFKPSSLGARTGGIALMSDTGDFYFNLSGKGIGAAGEWSANTSADFGEVLVGSTAERSFTLQNTGTVLANEVAVSLSDSSLSFVSNTCGTESAPATVAAGGYCTVTVAYSPTTSGALVNANLTASGRWANGPVVQHLAGSSPVIKTIVAAGDGRTWSDSSYAKSCSEYRHGDSTHRYAGAIGDGVYTIAPQGAPMNVYCDMTRDGGGWTMVVHGGAPGTLTGAMWNIPASVNEAGVANAANNAPASKFSDSIIAAIPRTAGYRFDIYGGTGSGITRYINTGCKYEHATSVVAGSPCNYSYDTLTHAQTRATTGRYGGGSMPWHKGFGDDANLGGNSIYLIVSHRISETDNSLWYTGDGNKSPVTNATQGGRYRLWVK